MNRGQKRDLFIVRLEMIQRKHNLTDKAFAQMLKRTSRMWEQWRNGRIGWTGMKLKTCYELTENLNNGMSRLLGRKVDWKFSQIIVEDDKNFIEKVLEI